MQWHLYCRVVDNFGDIGVAWRLAADLAGRGESVRLAVDDAGALAWLAPRGVAGVAVVGWDEGATSAPDVVVELFGGGLPEIAVTGGGGRDPVFINLEHLSAEAYVERSHGLPSPRRTTAGRAFTTWFFYPGFTAGTGGLLREPGLLERRRAFIGAHEGTRRARCRGTSGRAAGEPFLLSQRDDRAAPAVAGRNADAAAAHARCGKRPGQRRARPALRQGALRALRLPFLSQADFDRLLWSCDLNFVRGEDSFVRAIWAGTPFVWQLYPQDDGAHGAKLEAFLARYLAAAPPDLGGALRALFRRWNGSTSGAFELAPAGAGMNDAWARHAARWRDALAGHADLVARLLGFVATKR